MRSKIILGSVLGAVTIHVVFLACGNTGSGGALMDAMSDGGLMSIIRDAAADVIGLEVSDAHAQDASTRAMEAACDKTISDGSLTYYYAEISVPGFDPRTGPPVLARVCDFVCMKPTCGFGGDIGAPNATCMEQAGMRSEPGKISVMCGIEKDHGQVARVWLR